MRYSLPARFCTIVATGLLFMATACSKQEDVRPDTDSLTATTGETTAKLAIAQNWFEQPSRVDNNSSSSSLNLIASGQVVPPVIDWRKARITNEWVVAPFFDTSQPFSSLHKVGYRYVVIHTPVRGAVTGRIVELVLAETIGESQAAQFALQTTQSLLVAGRPSAIEGLSGWVLLYSPAYRYETGIVYQDGIVQPKTVEIKAQKPAPSTSSSKQRASNSSTTPTSSLIDGESVCYVATTCGQVYGVDAGCLTYYVCSSTGNSGGSGGGGSGGGDGVPSNGGGGPSWGGPPPLAFDDKIDDKTLNPCLTAVLNDIKLLGNGKIAEIIKKLSGSSPGFNWNVTSGNIGSQNSAITSRYNYSNNSVTTTFNNSSFSNASDLSAARTIIHESIHAYLVTYFASNTAMATKDYKNMFDAYFAAANPDLNAAQHNEMAVNWIQEIGYNLQQYGQSKGYQLSNDFYINMAWGGLTESTAFKSLSTTVQNEIKNVIIIESTGKDLSGNTQSPKGSSAGCP